MSHLQKNTQVGVDGPEVLQEWKFDTRNGLVVTRKDEDGNRVVLWRDVENMFAQSVPKYAHLGDFAIPFHVHLNLTEYASPIVFLSNLISVFFCCCRERCHRIDN